MNGPASGPRMEPPARSGLGIHVVATFDAIDPDAGTEQGIGWSWLVQIAKRVRTVSAVVPAEAEARLAGDRRLPANVALLVPPAARPPDRWSVWPRYYREYAAFHRAASGVVGEVAADVAHHVTLGTPYWGSSIAGARSPRLLGPVGISSPPPARIAWRAGWRSSTTEVVRSALLRSPLPPVDATGGIRAADHVLAVDDRTSALAARLHRPVTRMMQDGADPLPAASLVPVGERRHLVWAGRMMARKGLPIAIEAFSQAVPHLPGDVQLIVMGDGADRRAAARLVAERGLGSRVELTGFAPRADVMAVIATARALVFTSIRDTFGGVVLEAAERATPAVIALHRGVDGLRTWWPHDAGWLRPARTAREMAAGVASGMVEAATCPDDAWTARSQAAYRMAWQHGWERRGAAVADLYRRLLT